MLVPRKLTARGSRGSTRTVLVWLALATLLVLIVAMLVLREDRPHHPLAPAAIPLDERASPPPAELEVGVQETARAPANLPVPASQIDAPPPAATDDSAAFRVVGRFVQIDGTPVAGVPLRLHATVERETVDVTATSQASGRFTIAVAPRASLRVEIAAEPAEHCAVRWRWSGVDRARTEDVGDVPVFAGGTITGRILDTRGAPLVGQPWRVQFHQAALGGDKGREAVDLETIVDVATGTFEMRGLPPFRTQIIGDLDETNRFVGPIVDVRPNETTKVDVTCPVVGIRSRVLVRVAFPPFRDHRPPDCAPVVLSRPGAASREGRFEVSAFVFDDVPPGGSSLSIDDPRFHPWRQDNVEPGTVVQAGLVGNASVRLTVVDGTSGRPVGEFVVRSEVDDDPVYGQQLHAQVYEAHAAKDEHSLSGLLPIFQTIRVRAAGYADETVDVALQPGAITPIDVVMSHGGTVSGRVTLTDGTAPGDAVDVHILRKPRPIRRAPLLLAGETGVRTTRSDASTGAFSISRLSPGTYLIQASRSDAVHGPLSEVEIAAKGAAEHADLVVPALAGLSGRIVAPAGASFEGLKLHIVPQGQTFSETLSFRAYWLDRLPVSIASDGSYRVAALPAGLVEVRLRGPKVVAPNGFGSWGSSYPPAIDLGTIDLEPGENRHDFNLDGTFPGTVRVQVRVDREMPTGCVVELWGVSELYVGTAAAHVFELGDSARLGPLSPGDYPLIVRAVDMSWYWIAPDPVRIRSGEEVSARCDVELVPGTLRVRFAGSGEALVKGSVVIRADSSIHAPRILAPLDANGDAHLLLPPGSYTLGYSDNGRSWRKGISVPFAWPLPPNRSREIEIPPGEKAVQSRAGNAR